MTNRNWETKVQNTTQANAKKSGEYWTQRQIDTLFEKFDEGTSLEEIALLLERSYFAVSKMHSLGHREASAWVEKSKAKGQRVVGEFEKGFTDIEALFAD